MAEAHARLASILRRHEARLLADWTSQLSTAGRSGSIEKADLEEQARTFVRLLTWVGHHGVIGVFSTSLRSRLGVGLIDKADRIPVILEALARVRRRTPPRGSCSSSSSLRP